MEFYQTEIPELNQKHHDAASSHEQESYIVERTKHSKALHTHTPHNYATDFSSYPT